MGNCSPLGKFKEEYNTIHQIQDNNPSDDPYQYVKQYRIKSAEMNSEDNNHNKKNKIIQNHKNLLLHSGETSNIQNNNSNNNALINSSSQYPPISTHPTSNNHFVSNRETQTGISLLEGKDVNQYSNNRDYIQYKTPLKNIVIENPAYNFNQINNSSPLIIDSSKNCKELELTTNNDRKYLQSSQITVKKSKFISNEEKIRIPITSNIQLSNLNSSKIQKDDSLNSYFEDLNIENVIVEEDENEFIQVSDRKSNQNLNEKNHRKFENEDRRRSEIQDESHYQIDKEGDESYQKIPNMLQINPFHNYKCIVKNIEDENRSYKEVKSNYKEKESNNFLVPSKQNQMNVQKDIEFEKFNANKSSINEEKNNLEKIVKTNKFSEKIHPLFINEESSLPIEIYKRNTKSNDKNDLQIDIKKEITQIKYMAEPDLHINSKRKFEKPKIDKYKGDYIITVNSVFES